MPGLHLWLQIMQIFWGEHSYFYRLIHCKYVLYTDLPFPGICVGNERVRKERRGIDWYLYWFCFVLFSRKAEVYNLFFLSKKGNEHGYECLAANSIFCQIFWVLYHLSSWNLSSAGFSISVMFEIEDVQNQHDAGHLTCFTALVRVVLSMWFIPDTKVDANFAPRMDVRDLIEHWQIPDVLLFCSFEHFKIAVCLPCYKEGEPASVQPLETSF